MVIRCRCGRYTNFGMSCTNCKSSGFSWSSNSSKDEEPLIEDLVEESKDFEETEESEEPEKD